MNACELLYQAAGRPEVPGLISAAQWQAGQADAKLRRKLPNSPPERCYLTGIPISAGIPAKTRINDDTWTAHHEVACPDSEWLSAEASFSLLETATHPGRPTPFKMRGFSHLVVGDCWQVFGLSDKASLIAALLGPKSGDWFLSLCISPLGASHTIYKTPVNSAESAEFTVSLGGERATTTPDQFARILAAVELMYQFHSKGTLETGDYSPTQINLQGIAEWADGEQAIAPHRHSGVFRLALFLAQKPQE